MAQALGINYRTMVNWVENNKISEKGAIQIASKIPISQTYLLTGEGDPEVIQSNINHGVQVVGNAYGSSVAAATATVEKAGSTEDAKLLEQICKNAEKLDEVGRIKVLNYIWKLRGLLDE